MDKHPTFYTDPEAMEPLFPEDRSKRLEDMAIELITKANALSGKLHPITRSVIADFLRPVNSYYSNLIEGHDTHPIDIHRALKKQYSEDEKRRDLQLEAYAHIHVHKWISNEIHESKQPVNTASAAFLGSIHRKFYEHLPDGFKMAKTRDGRLQQVTPGKFRASEVEVGRHIGPAASYLDAFVKKFETFYDPRDPTNKSKIRRVISIAASHHRFAWIHPFLDGNGRVVRLFSDASFMNEALDASGLWSISRGLARAKDEYVANLAKADSPRLNDFDGRSNLSDKRLFEFCELFMEVAIDQIDYMTKVVDIDNMLDRIGKFSELMATRGKLKPATEYILKDVFLKGKLSKADAMRITNTSDKTLKNMTDQLIDFELLTYQKEGKEIMYYVHYPITFAPYLFPGLYPSGKEMDMLGDF